MRLGPRKGMVFVVSAPSGGGKTTLVSEVIKAFPGELFQVVTCTTRRPRAGEVNGKDYWFLTEKEFEEKRKNGGFLEYTNTFDHFYGTLKSSIEELQKKGSVFLVIDVKGVMAIKKEMKTISIFIEPPSMLELERRIRGRSSDDEKELEKRLIRAREELKMKDHYDYTLVNDDFAIAVEVIQSIIIGESFRRIGG